HEQNRAEQRRGDFAPRPAASRREGCLSLGEQRGFVAGYVELEQPSMFTNRICWEQAHERRGLVASAGPHEVVDFTVGQLERLSNKPALQENLDGQAVCADAA